MLSKDIIEKIIDLYLQGWSTRQIADAIGISKSVVGKIVKQSEIGRDNATSQILGCKRTTHIPFTWSFFPLTPDKAWLLGIIYGDGSLDNDKCKINISSGDYDVIDNINYFFGNRLSISSPAATYQSITLHSGRLWKELHVNFALVPNKSRVLCYPELPDEMKSHFVRGLLDSDGCWKTDRRNPQPKLVFEYVSLTKEFVELLRMDLIKYVGVSPKRTVCEGSGFVLLYTNLDAINIGHWVYANSGPRNRCERKFAYWSRFTR